MPKRPQTLQTAVALRPLAAAPKGFGSDPELRPAHQFCDLGAGGGSKRRIRLGWKQFV